MEMTEQEKKLIGLFKRIESQKSKADAVSYIEAMARAQDALRADYGLDKPTGKNVKGKPAA